MEIMYYCIWKLAAHLWLNVVAGVRVRRQMFTSKYLNKMKMIHFISYFRAKMKYEMVQNKYKNVIWK